MKHVVVHVGNQELLDKVQRVLLSRDDLVVDVVESLPARPRGRGSHTVVLTDLPQAEDSLPQVITEAGTDYAVPVVVLTSPQNLGLALQALRDGAASYVPSESVATELASTLDSVFEVAHEHHDRSRIMESMAQWNAEFVLENDRRLIGPLVRYFQEAAQRLSLFDENDETRLGIALEEALLNSMVHGNLEVPSSLRESDEAQFYALIEARRNELPFRERRITVRAEFCRGQARFVITDEGRGFDLCTVPDPTDPANVERVCGRGLLLMRTFMDEVAFNETGNQVRLVKRRLSDDSR